MSALRTVPPSEADGRRRAAVSSPAVAREIQREFPGVRVWYGQATGSWWAYVPLRGLARLVEAVTPDELRNAIVHARGWPWPR